MRNLQEKLCILFMAVVLLSASIITVKAEDTTPPEIEIIEQDFGEVKVGDIITIQAKITDESDLYSTGSGILIVDKGIGETRKNLKLVHKENNIYETEIIITEQMQPGEWYLYYYGNCTDVSGNKSESLNYNSFLGSPIKFTIVNDDFDPIAPVLSNLELVVNGTVAESGTSVTAGDKVKFQMDIQEDSGIASESYINVIYANRSKEFSLQYNETNNKYEIEEMEIPEDIEPCTLYISHYRIRDTKNNMLFEYFSEEESPIICVITNDEYDKTKPVINSVIVDKNEQTVYPDDSITIIVDATDNKAIGSVEVTFNGDIYNMEYDENSALYIITIPMKGIKVGTKRISVRVTDTKGNTMTNNDCWIKLDTPTYDDNAPVIENVNISIDKQGQTLLPSDTFTVTVEIDAYDDYGILDVDLGIRGTERFGFLNQGLEKEKISDKRYQWTYTISDNDSPCEYYIDYLTVHDISGNHTEYDIDSSKPYYFYINIKGTVNIPTYEVDFVNRIADTTTTEKVIRRGTITLPDVPKVNGYIFNGWKISRPGDAEYLQPGEKLTVMGNMTINATYTKNSSNNSGSNNRPGSGNDSSNDSDDSDEDDDDDSTSSDNTISSNNSSTSTLVQQQQQAITQLQSVSENGVVTVDMKNTTVLSAKVLETLKTKNADLVLDMGNYQWTIRKEDLWSTNLQDIDFGVKEGTTVIPQEMVESVTGGNPSMQIQLNHTGSFGLKAELSMKVDPTQAGKTGYLYYYDSKGVMKFIDAGKIAVDGTVKLDFTHASDYVLVFSSKDALEEKWLQDSNGWCYQNADGSYPKSDWKYSNGEWYYFDKSGYMIEGWNQQGSNWYYFNSVSGNMKTGWLKLKDQWYYFNEDGTMKKGWLLYDGRWFFLKKDGTMAIGWIKDNGKWYYMTGDGAWIYS